MDDVAYTFESIEPPLGRPLRASALATIVAGLLPLRIEAGGPLWPWQLGADPLALLLAFAPVLGGLALLAVASAPRLDPLRRGGLALLLAALVGLGLAASEDARIGLLPFVPTSIRDAGPAVLLAITAAATAARWRHGPRGPGADRVTRIAGLVALVTTLALYVRPWSTGPLLGALRTLRVALSEPLDPRVRLGLLLMVAVMALPAVLVARGLLRARRPPSPGGGGIADLVLLGPVVLVALSVKAAAAFGNDAVALLGLRSAALGAAAVAVGAHAVVAILAQLLDPWVAPGPHAERLLRDALLAEAIDAGPSPEPTHAAEGYRPTVVRLVAARLAELDARIAELRPDLEPRARLRAVRQVLGGVDLEARLLEADRDAWARAEAPRPRPPLGARFWARGRRLEALGIAILLLGVVGAAVVREATRPVVPEWALADAPEWAETLWGEALPEIAIAAQWARETPPDPEPLAAATARALELAAPVPALRAPIEAMAAAAVEPGRRRRQLWRAGDALNEAARRAGLPLYLDVNVRGLVQDRWTTRWLFFVKSYRVRRLRVGHAEGGRHGALWLDRLDRTNVVETRLGWRKHGQRFGMVILDQLREHWRRSLRPSLVGEALDGPRSGYADHAQALEAELLGELRIRDPAAAEAVALDLACRRHGRAGLDCARASERAESAAVEALARKVEVHELQHVIDGDARPPPDALRSAMEGYDEDGVAAAAAELSAYLGEVARAPLPRLGLVHLAVLAALEPYGPEAWAASVVRPALGARDLDALLALPPDALRAVAGEAYAALFGAPPPPLVVEDGAVAPEPASN